MIFPLLHVLEVPCKKHVNDGENTVNVSKQRAKIM